MKLIGAVVIIAMAVIWYIVRYTPDPLRQTTAATTQSIVPPDDTGLVLVKTDSTVVVFRNRIVDTVCEMSSVEIIEDGDRCTSLESGETFTVKQRCIIMGVGDEEMARQHVVGEGEVGLDIPSSIEYSLCFCALDRATWSRTVKGVIQVIYLSDNILVSSDSGVPGTSYGVSELYNSYGSRIAQITYSHRIDQISIPPNEKYILVNGGGAITIIQQKDLSEYWSISGKYDSEEPVYSETGKYVGMYVGLSDDYKTETGQGAEILDVTNRKIYRIGADRTIREVNDNGTAVISLWPQYIGAALENQTVRFK